MQCYFMRKGHVAAVEELTGLSEEEARDKAYQLFFERWDSFDGFELRDRARVITRNAVSRAPRPHRSHI
jgi:hypothetical protein